MAADPPAPRRRATQRSTKIKGKHVQKEYHKAIESLGKARQYEWCIVCAHGDGVAEDAVKGSKLEGEVEDLVMRLKQCSENCELKVTTVEAADEKSIFIKALPLPQTPLRAHTIRTRTRMHARTHSTSAFRALAVQHNPSSSPANGQQPGYVKM